MRKALVAIAFLILILCSCTQIPPIDKLRLDMMGEGICVVYMTLEGESVVYHIELLDHDKEAAISEMGRKADRLWRIEVGRDIVFGEREETAYNALVWIYEYIKEI